MKPNLVVIGSRKCATTSLHDYLGRHPEISMSAEKELNFFVKELRWKKGIRWYENQFLAPAKVRGESSPNYTRFPLWKGVPERMHSVLPHAKLIYLVRDPIERIISAYYHDLKGGTETRAFEEIMGPDLEQGPYVHISRYYFQLTQFLKYYSRSQILVVAAEDLKTNPYGMMRHIFEFLGVDSAFRSPEFQVMKNVSAESVFSRKPCKLERLAASYEEKSQWLGQIARATVPLYLKLRKRKPREPQTELIRPIPSPRLKQRLREVFKADVQKLRAWTGQSFEAWSV